MNKLINITSSEPQQDLDQYVVNLFAKVQGSQKRLGTLWLDSDLEARSFAKAVEALPELLQAVDFYLEAMEQKPVTNEQASLLGREVYNRLKLAHDKAKL